VQEPGAQRKPPPSMKLQEVLSSSPSDAFFEHLLHSYIASGVSGVQPKVLVPVANRVTLPQPTLIVKAAGATPFLTQNEFLCMDAAKRAGLTVPECHLSADGGLFVMKRFDRPEGALPLGFEDMVVVMGKRAAAKYEGSYENIAKAVRIYCGENTSESLHRLFGYVAISVMVRNGDAHLKNFGLVYEHPHQQTSVRLAPLYDVVTTAAYPALPGTRILDKTLALKLGRDRRYPARDALLRFGREVCLVQRPEQVIERIAQGMREAWQEHQGLFSAEMAQRIRAQWDEGLATVG
jgi:serine/threonine-protein kinase HipA